MYLHTRQASFRYLYSENVLAVFVLTSMRQPGMGVYWTIKHQTDMLRQWTPHELPWGVVILAFT